MSKHRVKNGRVQQTKIILDDLMRELGTVNERFAGQILKQVLTMLARYLPVEIAEQFRGRLPFTLQNTFSKGQKPRIVRKSNTDPIAEIYDHLKNGPTGREETETIVKATLRYLASFVSVSDSRKMRAALPEPLRKLWPAW